ncbi:MAG: type II toxin-antitoxin system HipA family toxin [Bacteroidales bacterium]|nr:type II toxin-antitoxin system HipA family toxin [Bacteroidales bacterium]
MKSIDKILVYYRNQKVGTLALTLDHLLAFEYDAEFLQNGFSISPFHLPLQGGVFVAPRKPFGGNFGIFDDALPDGWGNLILDRYLKEKGIQPNSLTLLQRLALVGSSGRGALEFKPDWNDYQIEEIKNFDRVSSEIKKIINDVKDANPFFLYQYAGSPGGARPKIFVRHNNEEWMVKFPSGNDTDNIGKTEYEYALLAKACGIEMSEVNLFQNRFFGTKRFDRMPEGKIHTISVAGLLNADYRSPSIDYNDLLKMGFILTKNMEELVKIFRLMVFNVAIGNKDDHARNFAFQYKENQWVFAPAYDILPSNGFNGSHNTTVSGKGNPSMADMLKVSKENGLNVKITENIITGTLKKVSEK